MDERKRKARRMLEDELPAEIIDPLIKLHRRREKINLKFLRREIFLLIGMVQMTVRHANLPAENEEAARYMVDSMIAEIANIEPILEHYLLLGWNPEHDQPLREKERD